MEPSPIFSIIKQKLDKEFRALEEKQVTPWAFFGVAKPFRVEKFDGGDITYQGIKFCGSCRLVFWGPYIRLFLEDIIDRAFTDTRKFCVDHKIPRVLPLQETSSQLQEGCSRIYNRMADIDQKLRGEGTPDSVYKRDISRELEDINNFIHSRFTSENALLSRAEARTINSWYENNKFWVWVIGIAASALVGVFTKIFF